MLVTFLFLLLAAASIAAAVFAGLYFEDRRRSPGHVLRKWRLAWSRRRRVADAELREQLAKQRAAAAVNQQRAAEAEVQRVTAACDDRLAMMGSYIIAEQAGEHIKKVRANNFHAKEKKIHSAIRVAEQNGYSLPIDERVQLDRMLKQAHERAIRIEAEREKQAEIKAEMREEKRRQKEVQRAIREAEKEERIKQEALNQAIALLGDTHSEQVEQLKKDLQEAQEKAARAKSQAELTKSGHIYVISNIGSFGRGIYKVGMTRRLDPMDRVTELGDASVPFGFDVHAMFSSENAPALEAALHRELHGTRVNRVNTRKEFFRAELSSIITAVERHHGRIDYEADAEALEYLETQAIEEAQQSKSFSVPASTTRPATDALLNKRKEPAGATR